MKRTIDLHDFINEFRAFDGRYEQLGGREGLRLLFQYLEEREVDSGEDMELDVIALCCDYCCQSLEQTAQDHELDLRDMTEDECMDAVMDYLMDHTVVIDRLSDGRLLYQQF
jgi:hypothetical protein